MIEATIFCNHNKVVEIRSGATVCGMEPVSEIQFHLYLLCFVGLAGRYLVECAGIKNMFSFCKSLIFVEQFTKMRIVISCFSELLGRHACNAAAYVRAAICILNMITLQSLRYATPLRSVTLRRTLSCIMSCWVNYIYIHYDNCCTLHAHTQTHKITQNHRNKPTHASPSAIICHAALIHMLVACSSVWKTMILQSAQLTKTPGSSVTEPMCDRCEQENGMQSYAIAANRTPKTRQWNCLRLRSNTRGPVGSGNRMIGP